MGRKKPEPRHMGEEQRRVVEWNMMDIPGQSTQQFDTRGDLTIVQDNDPALAVEWEAAEKDRKSEAGSKAVFKGSSGTGGLFGAGASAQLSSDNSSKSAECASVLPDNVQQFFRRLEICLKMVEVKNHSLCLPLYSINHSRSREVLDNWHWVVGRFNVHLRDYDDLPLTFELAQCLSNLQQCKLYIGCEHEDEPVVCFEVHDEELKRERLDKAEQELNGKGITRRLSGLNSNRKQEAADHLGLFWAVDLEFSDRWKFFQKLSRSGQKKFQLVYGEFDSSGKQFEVTVYGRKDSLQRLDHPSQGFVIRELNNFLYEAMNHFYKLGPMYDREMCSLRQDFQELYEGVRAQQIFQTFFVDIEIQHPSLKPLLRPYQRDAVCWMLKQEQFHGDVTDGDKDDDLHPLYTEVVTRCGKTLFYNRQGGSLILEKPRKVTSPPGGILADEMGLGKTVEVLCCLLLHPRPTIPLPSRLPTLAEMENQLEESSLEASVISASSSSSDLPSLGCYIIENSEVERQTLKRVESDSGSISSVPSEAVSLFVTDDHSYQIKSATDLGDSSAFEHENLTSHAAAVRLAADTATNSEPDFKSPLKLTLKRVSSKNPETMNEQPDAEIDLEQETSAQEKKVQSKNKHKTSNGKQSVQTKKKGKNNSKKLNAKEQKHKNGTVQPKAQKRKPFRPSEDDNSSETENACSKNKRTRSSRYFYYATDENIRQTFFDNVAKFKKKQLFECVCGKGENDTKIRNGSASSRKKRKHPVKCIECGTSQHAECVNYDLEDPFRGSYKCPHCHYNGTPLPSGATLIISPYSIAHQWIDEIQKHIQEKSLRVFEYTGVRYQGYIQPQTLASQDIVITTYETLRNELNYVDLKPTNSDQGRVLRNPKKFMAQPTPLTTVEWWRICLDEAQMVESVTTKTAEMALRLSCVNRWCVTGTPLNQSIKDLYGLLAFIGYDPYCVEEWWTRFLYEPYLQGIKEPMFETLAKVMWRTSMKDVKSQLNLPDKSEVIQHLTFSPVEDVFYRRLYQKCCREIMGSTFYVSEEKKSTKLKKLDHQTVNKYLIPLRKLRQACCHPQAVSGSSLSMKNSILTMDELLDNLIKKTVVECEESHRCMIAAMNGQAGIYLIEEEPRVVEAVEMYRAVLRSVEELEKQKKLKTDALPHIHALHNLAEVLATQPAGVGHTIRDDQLATQCEELKKQYLQKASGAVTAGKDQLTPLHHSAKDIKEQLGSGLHWYQQVNRQAVQCGNEDLLLQKVRASLADLTPGLTKTFHNMSGLQYIIISDLTELQTLREQQMKLMKELERCNLKEEMILCCLRPVDGVPQRKCIFCKLEVDFLNWESRLFCMTISQRTQAGVENALYRDGSWKDSPLETILKALHSYAKSHQLDGQILREAAMVFSLFDVWKKEFRHMRALWTKLKEEVSAADEVEMAVTRMRLRLPGEEEREFKDMNICEKVELPAMLRKFATDQKIYASQLKVRCGQLDYLRNLAKGNSGEFQDGINPEECPICKSALGRNWSVLHCGHCCCITCIQHLIDRCPASRVGDIAVKCMICRERTKASEISYISTSRSSASDSSIKGSHSTKVGAIVQCLLDIQKEDPEAKALVFATWVDVLKVIGKAMDDNFIKYTQLYDHGSNFEKNVTKFRTDKSLQVLLLPYSTGSKGLNLFEASHVLLVEPTYSPSEEAQAIGRVYRMGQTRPTRIYRFLVRRTIEERIHTLMESTLRPAADANETDKDAITLGQLISLFEDCDDEQEDSEDADNETDQEQRSGRTGIGVMEGSSQSSSGNDSLSGPVAGPSSVPDVLGSHFPSVTGLQTAAGPSGMVGLSSGSNDLGPSIPGANHASNSMAGPGILEVNHRTGCLPGVLKWGEEIGLDTVPGDITGFGGSSPASLSADSSCVSAGTGMEMDIMEGSSDSVTTEEMSRLNSVSVIPEPSDASGVTEPENVPGGTGSDGGFGFTRSEDVFGITELGDLQDTPNIIEPEHVQVIPAVMGSEDVLQVTGPRDVPQVTGPEDVPSLIGSRISDIMEYKDVPEIMGPENIPIFMESENLSDVSRENVLGTSGQKNVSIHTGFEAIPDAIKSEDVPSVTGPEDVPIFKGPGDSGVMEPKDIPGSPGSENIPCTEPDLSGVSDNEKIQ